MRQRLLSITLVVGLTFISMQPRTTPAGPGGLSPQLVSSGDPDDLGQRPSSSPDHWLAEFAGWVLTWLSAGEAL